MQRYFRQTQKFSRLNQNKICWQQEKNEKKKGRVTNRRISFNLNHDNNVEKDLVIIYLCSRYSRRTDIV